MQDRPQILRRIERALTLFFGSLAPGLAERHIQARAAAEESRLREVREREERVEREQREEEARQAETSNATANNESAEALSKAQAKEGQSANQTPLVKV